MKIFPAVVLLLFSFFIIQLTFAQDSSVNNPDGVQDTSVHSLSGPKKAIRHKHIAKDSLGVASLLQDTSIHHIPKSTLHKRIIRDSLGNVLIQPGDTSVHNLSKSVRHKRIIRDSLGNMITLSTDTSLYNSPVPKRPLRHRKISTDSTGNSVSILADSSIHSLPVLKKIKRKHIFTDSSDRKELMDSSDRDLHLSLNTYLQTISMLKKNQRHRVSGSDPSDTNDSIVYIYTLPSEEQIAELTALLATQDSLKLLADSVYADSVRRHWAGWKKYQVQPEYSYSLFSKRVLKGKSKTELQYNIADFYLYLNGELVMPPITGYGFFAAGCLCFKYDDTLLLNSGLGSKVGVGVGIKIIGGRFTSLLHANTHNTDVYKLSADDSVYIKSVQVAPATQTLRLQNEPDYGSNEIIIGEYRASYQKFYQKNEDDQDEARQYTVRIIFRCRVSGGINSMKSEGNSNGK